MGRESSDEAYLLTLCDQALGEVGKRQHRFDWLLGDPGRNGRCARLPVDGYWPHFDKPHRLTVSGVHRGVQRGIYDARRDERIPARGIRLVIITPGDLDASPRGRLRRNEDHDLPAIRRRLDPTAT